MMALYSLALVLGLLIASPWWIFRMLTTDRYREGLAQRLGFVPQSLLAYIQGHKTIWLHAVSVGEVLAASRLITDLEAALGETYRIVISTTTKTGQHLARERFGAERVFYMPLDFAVTTRRYLRALQPTALLLTESELWPRLLHECNTRNIPVVVINARVSDRSFARGMKFRTIWQRILRKPTLLLAQSEQDAQRLIEMGAPQANVIASGNLKYDIRAPKENRAAALIKEVAQDRPIIVAGSTVASTDLKVEAEEAQIIEAWMKGALPSNALLVLAPRHPDRFEEAWKFAYEFPSLRVTELLAGKTASNAVTRTAPNGGLTTTDVLLLDTIGDLSAVYGIAAIAYVGGSMFRRGGHNPLEPAQFGVPIIMGDSYENFRAIVERMMAEDAIRIVKDEIELTDEFERLLSNPAEARALGGRGRQVYLSQQGATARTVAAITKLVQP